MTVRIAIDCRKIADFGIGTYIRGILGGLARCPGEEEYILLIPSELQSLAPDDPRFLLVAESSKKYSMEEVLKVGRAADREGAVLFHAPHYVVPATSARVVVTIHDLIHLHQPLANPLARFYARVMVGRAARRADRIITVSHAVRREITERFPRSAGRVETIPNGVDEIFRSPGVRGLPGRGAEDGHYFLFVGNPKPHKNLPRLMEAFQLVRRSRPALKLVIAGADSVRSDAQRGIVSTGFVEAAELASLYAGAIALVQPSLEEGFGLPVAEAMAAGTAVVISSTPALIEVASDAAWRIDPHSVHSIAGALSELARDPALRSRLALAAGKRSSFFDWGRCAEQTLEVYRSVIRQPFSR
jgi:glycosyltransferase involved in cell wall biosynthesis